MDGFCGLQVREVSLPDVPGIVWSRDVDVTKLCQILLNIDDLWNISEIWYKYTTLKEILHMTSYDNHLILTCVWWRIEVKRVVKFCTHVTRCEEVYESLWVSWSIVVQKTSDWNLRMMTCCLRGQKRSSFYSDCAWKVRRQSGTRTIKTSRNSL